MSTRHLDDLRAHVQYARPRYGLYRRGLWTTPTREARMRELERACEGHRHVFAPLRLRSGALTGRRCAAWSELMPDRAAHRANHPYCRVSRDATANRQETPYSPLAQLVASPAPLASWATWPPTRFAVVARVVDVLARGPIRGGLQAHDAVAPLDPAATGADGRVAATKTNGRGVCGDRRRPRSQMTKRKAPVHLTTALWPGRSGAGEGVGAGRRPAAVEIGDGRRCGPFCGL